MRFYEFRRTDIIEEVDELYSEKKLIRELLRMEINIDLPLKKNFLKKLPGLKKTGDSFTFDHNGKVYSITVAT